MIRSCFTLFHSVSFPGCLPQPRLTPCIYSVSDGSVSRHGPLLSRHDTQTPAVYGTRVRSVHHDGNRNHIYISCYATTGKYSRTPTET